MKIPTLSFAARVKTLLVFAGLLCASAAYAGNFWQPIDGWANEESVIYLKMLFGKVIVDLTTGGGLTAPSASGPLDAPLVNNILSQLLATMNSGVLIIGMILMAYTYIGGAVATARDGEWLGKKWDTVMVPLRTAGGIAMLLPTVAGYSFLQVVLIWCGLQAVGLADTVWKSGYTFLQNQQLISPPYIQTHHTAEQVFLMATCKAAGAKFGWTVTQSGDLGSGYITYNVPQYLGLVGSGACGTISWSQTPGWKKAYSKLSTVVLNGVNGSADGTTMINGNNGSSSSSTFFNPLFRFMGARPQIITDVSAKPFDSFNMEGADSVYLLSNNDGTNSAVQFEEHVRQAHGQIISNMLTGQGPVYKALLDLAQKVTESTDDAKKSYTYSNSDFSTIAAAQAQYENDLSVAVSNYLHSDIFPSGSGASFWMNKMLDKMKTGGWIHAGSFYMKIGHLNNAIQTKVNQTTSTVYAIPDITKMQNEAQNSEFSAFLINVQEAMNGSRELSKTVDSTSKGMGTSLLSRAWAGVTGAFTDSFVNFAMIGQIGKSGLDPLVQVKNIGDTTLFAAETALALAPESLTNATGGSDGGDKGGSGASILAIIASLAIGAMLTAGAYLSVILPMTPYIFWVMGVAWWFIAFLQAVVAAPLWAIAHMHPEGHDIAGKGSPGYMFALSILVRPALMVIFLFGAMLLIKPIMMFVNQGFFEAISNMTEGSTAGMMTLIGTLIIYSLITTKSITMVFGQINTGPDAVFRWIGGSDSVGANAGESANSIASDAQRGGTTASGGVGQVAGSMIFRRRRATAVSGK